MKKSLLLLFFSCLMAICNAQLTKVHNEPSISMQSVFCLNKDTVYVCCTNRILLRTFDGGITWKKDTLRLDGDLNSIFMQKNGIGVLVQDNGVIYKTTQFGLNWTPIIAAQTNIGDVKMVNDSMIFLLKDYTFIYEDPIKKSGNLFFININTKKADTIFYTDKYHPLVNEYSFFCKDSIIILSSHFVKYSSNHGKKWVMKGNYGVYSIDIKNTSSGFLGRNNYDIYKTSDTCENSNLYQELSNKPTGTAERDVQFLFVINDSTTYIAGSSQCCGPAYSYIARTMDGGKTWVSRFNDIYIYDMQIVSSTDGYIIDDHNVYKIAKGCLYEDCRVVTNADENKIKPTQSFSIFPNPMNDKTVISSTFNNTYIFELYNQLGVLVDNHTISTSQYEIQKANKQAGCYFYKIKSDKNELLQTGKLIIE